MIIHHLHRTLKEFIKKLSAVTSGLDGVVACINVLCAMENQHFVAMLWIEYAVYFNSANSFEKEIKIHTS